MKYIHEEYLDSNHFYLVINIMSDLSKIWYVKFDKISYHFEQAENTLVKDRKKVTSHAQRRVTSEVSRKEIRYIQ